MVLLRIVAVMALGACWSGIAGAASWREVPGAPEVEIALDSMQLERQLVLVWLRMPGRSTLAPDLAAPAPRAPRIHRTALHMAFDCGHRTVRVLAATGYGATGAPLAMTSTPGRTRPVEGGEMGWAYDAVCEAARTERRL